MAYSEPDPELCKKYAQFASHMVRWQFKVIYWTMFIANLFVLFLASWSFTKAQTAADRLKDNPKKRSKTIRMYMLLCLGCIVVSTVIVVMEVYSLMALQFCDGEDLISLYWSSFMMIQVGSLIAMIGIILSMIHQLRNSAHPPWALALGTPVLVIAGFLHLFHLGTKTKIKKMRAASTSTASSGDPNAGPPISQVNTIQVDDENELGDISKDTMRDVDYIGITIDGGPIIRFNRPITSVPFGGNPVMLGRDELGRTIASWPRDAARYFTDPEK